MTLRLDVCFILVQDRAKELELFSTILKVKIYSIYKIIIVYALIMKICSLSLFPLTLNPDDNNV